MAYRSVYAVLGLAALLLLIALSNQRGEQGTRSQTPPSERDFEAPMCEPDGSCHEKPDVASPRTVYSAKSFAQYQAWWTLHDSLVRKGTEFAAGRRAPLPTFPLVLLGDSITESWQGSSYGSTTGSRLAGVKEVLPRLASEVGADPLVMGISGDQTQHLLYRMATELPPMLREDPRALFLVMIGTNNLGSGHSPEPTSRGVLAVARWLLERTQGKLVLAKLLPRGDHSKLVPLCPPRCADDGAAYKSFASAIDKVNELVEASFEELGAAFGTHRTTLIDCNTHFVAPDGGVRPELMPDMLHPNAKGLGFLAQCYREAIVTGRAKTTERPRSLF